MRRLRFIILFGTSIGIHGTIAAQVNHDSLWKAWSDTSLNDTVRVRALHWYAWSKYLYSEPDSAEYYGQVMYDFAEQHGLTKWMAWALRGQGVSFKIRGANAKALDYWLRSEELSRSVNDQTGVAGSVNNIGLLYFELGDLPHALENHRRSLALRVLSGDTIGEGASLLSIGDIHRLEGSEDSAMAYANQGLHHFKRIGYRPGEGMAHQSLGELYLARKEYDAALSHLRLGLEIGRQVGNELRVIDCLRLIGETRIAMGDPAGAASSCKEAFALAKTSTNLIGQKKACDCLYSANRALGIREEALRQLELSKTLDDSLRTADIAMRLQYMEFTKQLYADSVLAAERVQREALVAEAAMARERTRRNILYLAILGVLVLAGGLWSRLRYINRTNAIIKSEKNRSDELLLNILPADVAEELKTKGSSEARTIEQATILFSDFKGFTHLSEKLNATELVAEIDACFEAFDGIMGRFGVEKIKTIGDAYMAAGGLRAPSDLAVLNTVRAALEMQGFIAGRKREREATGGPAFEMRVGIHTGPVVAGIVGVKKFQYDLWGDTVNTAHCMEVCGEAGLVNISKATYEIVKAAPGLVFTPRGRIQTKGKGEMVMYFVSATA